MGSRTSPDAAKPHDSFNVLVTGFGAFKERYPRNPSWEIAAQLPKYLPVANAHDQRQRQRPSIPPVRIYVHPAPIRVSYPVVRALVPKLWEGTATREDSDSARDVPLDSPVSRTPDREEDGPPPGTRIDLVVHIGMAGPRRVYQVETLAHRDGYKMPDVDGELLGDDEPDPETGRAPRDDLEGWPWSGTPEELRTAFKLGDVYKRWRELLPGGTPLMVSKDPGRYLCDFIYFSSLAYLHRRKERRRVVFLHVPCDPDEAILREGKEVALRLIQALIESQTAAEEKESGKGESDGES